MKNLSFFLIVFNGKGWVTPIRDFLSKSKFKSYVVNLADLGIFNLSDVFILKNKGLLSLKLNHLDLDSSEREELEEILNGLLSDLSKYEKLKNNILKYSIITVFFLFISYSLFNVVKNHFDSKIREVNSIKMDIERKKNGIRTIEEDLVKIQKEIEDCQNG